MARNRRSKITAKKKSAKRKTTRTKRKSKGNSLFMPWDEMQDEMLSDPEVALGYIKESMGSHKEFLMALRDVAQAQGMGKVAKRTKLPRESLYRMLNGKGSLRFENLLLILMALGFRVSIDIMPKKEKRQVKQKQRKAS